MKPPALTRPTSKQFTKPNGVGNTVLQQRTATVTVDTLTASFLESPVLQRETFSIEMRSIWKWVLLRSGHTAYRLFPAISLQNPFAHVHWEALKHNNPNGGSHEIDPRRSLRPTALFEWSSPLRP